MGGIRADWHVGDLDLPGDADPLQEIAQLQSGHKIDLTVTGDELIAEMDRLLEREGRFFQYAKDDDGVTPLECDLKQRDDHRINNASGTLSCYACPKFTADRASARSLICTLGREQENVIEQYRAIAIATSLEDELFAAYRHDFERDAELAEAWLATA